MTNNNSAQFSAGDWEDCQGEVGHLVHRLRWRRRSTRVRRGALLATLAIVTIGGNFFYSAFATELSVKATGSPCDHYTQELRAFYCDRSLNELDVAFWDHVAKCPDCQREFRFMGGISQTRLAHHSPHNKRAQSAGAMHHISLDELLRQATFAARQ